MTSKPQHVQDYETVRHGLCSAYEEGHAAVARLRDEAAKVPGLEAELADVRAAWHQATKDADSLRSAVEWRAQQIATLAELADPTSMDGAYTTVERVVTQHAALLERLAKAESERDALKESLANVTADRDRAIARIATLEREREADRYAIHGVLLWAGEWGPGYNDRPSRHVAALLERLAKAEAERDEARQKAATLRERVATLERESDLAVNGPGGWRDVLKVEEVLKDNARAALVRAEARVKELEAAIRAKADDYRASHGEDAEGPHPMVDWAERVLRGASQPPPALVEAVAKVLEAFDATKRPGQPDDVVPALRARDAAVASLRAAYDAARSAPGPQGLLEAVGPFVPWARELVDFWDASQPDDTKTAYMGGHVFTLGFARRLVAAYDAAKGGAR